MKHPDVSNLPGPVVASISGGKDSTALCLHLMEQGIPYIAVHMDTGWEHADTDAYIREVLPQHIGEVKWLMPERTMIPLIHHKGMFPSRVRRYCTQYLKIFVLQQWLEDNFAGDVVNAVGIRSAESQARSKLGEWEDIEWAWTWRPLLDWSEDDVIAIHKRHGVRPNPLYLKGMSRVGCWPCIFARKEEIRKMAETDPSRVDLIRQLESEVAAAAAARYAEKGETFESQGFVKPTFFALKKYVKEPCLHCRGTDYHQPTGLLVTCCPDCKGKGEVTIRKNVCVPVDEVVEWSKTSRGGKQYEMFSLSDDGRSGCMRWGLCDSD